MHAELLLRIESKMKAQLHRHSHRDPKDGRNGAPLEGPVKHDR